MTRTRLTSLAAATAIVLAASTTHGQTANPLSASAKGQFAAISGFVARSAEKIPELTTHTYEHYGNMVTYMRLNTIVPPSSETAPAPAR